MKMWTRALVIGSAVAVAVLAVAAIAAAFGGLDRGPSFGRMDGGMMFAADGAGTRGEGSGGCGGSGLMQDPQAREEMWALRGEHQDEMRAWWDEYGDDPQSDEAQEALGKLREEHRADMLKLFDKYGVTPPDDFGQGGRGGPATGGCDGSGSGGCGGTGSGGCGGQGPGSGTIPSPGEGTAYGGSSL
jgi:hypothetical protein